MAKEKSLAVTEIRTLDLPVRSIITVQTELVKRRFKAFVLDFVQSRPVSIRLHQRHMSTDNLQVYLRFLKDKCFVPSRVVLVANCDGRKRDILDREVCTLKHSHGRAGLILCPDVRRCVQRPADSQGAQYYPDGSVSISSS
jgi:hypothetical protein